MGRILSPMQRILPASAFVLCVAAVSLSAEETFPGLRAVLTTEEWKNSGLDQLTPEQIRILETALRRPSGVPAPEPPLSDPSAASVVVAPSESSPPDPVLKLPPFEIRNQADHGYLQTNSVTATRIGTDIQRIPLSVSVISEQFLVDTQARDIQDVLRYQSTSAGDTRMGVLQPATGFTPSGNFSLRGFPINSRLRNGLARYNQYTLDNVDRVEIIKGPAAVFFGQAFPGGVINYLTRKPRFEATPTSLTYAYGGNAHRSGSRRVTLDHNAVLSPQAAFRVVGAWDDAVGDSRFEYQRGFSIAPSLAWVPWADGRLRLTLEAEHAQRTRNQDDSTWMYPEQWFQDYAAPPAALIAAAGVADATAYRTRIFSSPTNWIADVRKAAADPTLPLWTQPLRHGAYITNAAGQRVFDPEFSYYGAGTYAEDENTSVTATVDFAPARGIDVRYAFTGEDSRYSENKASATPNADGITWQTMNGILRRDYILEAATHQLDVILQGERAGLGHKLLVGGLAREAYTTYTGTNAPNLAGTGQFPFFGNLPGSFDQPDEGYVSPIPAAFRSTSFAGNFRQQFVRNRAGQILTPMQIFSQYDPGIHPFPDIRRITEVSRGLVDHARPKQRDWYVNYQASALQDRLTVFAGYRAERTLGNGGQLIAANAPWYVAPPYGLDMIPASDWAAYGLSSQFSRSVNRKGDSKMLGFSYAVKPGVNLYTSYSQTYGPNGPLTLGGDYDPAVVRDRAASLGLDPEVTLAALAPDGLRAIRNETGRNLEIGLKLALRDNRLVGTLAVFRVDRLNRGLDDSQRQTDDPLNYTGPGKTGAFNRIVRWYGNDAEQRTEGAEFEAIWTPIPRLQAIVSGSWMWTARTIHDPTLTLTNPATPIVYGNRLPYAPEYRFNVFQKYTFADGLLGPLGRGASVGLGARYASRINLSLDQNYNPGRGGLTAGNYLVFDSVLNYPFTFQGYDLSASFAVNNLLNEEYSEGGANLSPLRTWQFTFGAKF